MSSEELPIVDSHIHLYAQTHLPHLNWTADLPSDHILNRQSSVDQYRSATRGNRNLKGFIFVETDRKSSLEEEGWADPLQEVAFLARIASSQPKLGEGHTGSDGRLVLGIVPWAPIPAGAAAMKSYVGQVYRFCSGKGSIDRIVGFRYLVQDKPAGTMMQPGFIEALKWMGDEGWTFDLGIDLRQGGIGQLREARELFDEVYKDGNKLKVVINHCCKPNLRLSDEEAVQTEDFKEWSECMMVFARRPGAYMKLSGFFSELPPQEEGQATPVEQLLQQVKPWVDVVFKAFGPDRLMFGSDWPVCTAGGPGVEAWHHWVRLVEAILDDQKLTLDEKRRVWSGTAMEAYGIRERW